MKLNEVLNLIKPADKDIYEQAKERTANLIMPPRAMGELNNLGERICAMTGTMKPAVDKKCNFIMAGDHGVVQEGVSAFPQEVTCQMIGAFLGGLATINALARTAGADIVVTDVGTCCSHQPAEVKGGKLYVEKIAEGTANFAKGAAMTIEQAEQSILKGFEITDKEIKEKGYNLISTGEMGIGNTTPASAIGAVITGNSIETMTGKGSGINDKSLNNKKEVIRKGIELNKPDAGDGLSVLSAVGGFEIGAIAGIILAAAANRIPVVVDGLISTAGALIAKTVCPDSLDYMISGHCSEEPGHILMLEHLELKPLLSLGMRLGEGTGAVVAMACVESAVSVMTEVATFQEAGVSVSE